MSYRVEDGPVYRWVQGQPLNFYPQGSRLVSHNAAFERAIWNHKFAPQWPITVEQQDCTLARASALGLPAGLENLGKALNAPVQKDTEGHRLMMQMCKPRTLGPLTWWDDDDRRERLQAYCDRDVDAECAIDLLLPALSERERRIWALDQKINDRGIALDLPSVHRAIALVAEAKRRADRQVRVLTNGAVTAITQAARIADWISSRGIPCESVAEGDHEALISDADFLSDPLVAAVVRLRGTSSKAFKFEAMLKAVCADGRVRGSFQYHGAHTGRWTGRGVQFQNMKRVGTEEDERTVALTLSILQRDMVPSDAIDLMDMCGLDPLDALSLCTRAMVVAAPGRKLVAGDFTNVEGRINAWLAGETWKTQAFLDYDAGTGPDLYRVMAASILDKTVDSVTKDDRQIWGKVPELACGYQGGKKAFQKMGANYGVRLPGAKAMEIVCGWRGQNTEIVEMWRELQDAALNAVSEPGLVLTVRRRIKYRCHGDFLYCQLPSDRVIAYAAPAIEYKHVVFLDGEPHRVAGPGSPQAKKLVAEGGDLVSGYGLTYWGSHQGRWMKLDLYGGAQCAHVVQGTARDLLADAMERVEAAGYTLTGTIHDECISEVDAGFGSAEEYARLMGISPPWAKGLPIAVKAWEGDRYVK